MKIVLATIPDGPLVELLKSHSIYGCLMVFLELLLI